MARHCSIPTEGDVPWRVLTPALFLGFFLFLWLRVEPALQLYAVGTPFFLDREFFRECLGHSGGLVEYAAAFLAQLSHHSWMGALSFTSLVLLLVLLSRRFFGHTAGTPTRRAHLVPAFLLILLGSRYDCSAWQIVIQMLLSLGFATGYGWLPSRSGGLRLAVFWALSTVLFCGAGIGPCFLFTVLSAALEFVVHRRRLLGIGCLCLGWASARVAGLLWDLYPVDPFAHWGNGYLVSLRTGLYLFFPLALLTLRGLQGRGGDGLELPPHKDRFSRALAWLQSRWNRRLEFWSLPVVLVFGAALVFLTFDAWRKALIQLDYFAGQKNWDQVLRLAYRVQTHGAAARLQINRALFHSNRLGTDMFSFGQIPGLDLIPCLDEGLAPCRAMSDTLLELGQVNLAEHFACEALEAEGDRPAILLQLARINVLKDHPQAARRFLRRLAEIPFHGPEAADWLRQLDIDAQLFGHAELSRIRSVMVDTDYASSRPSTESLLRQLLHTNPRNRMAFEYLMAHFLLNGKLDMVAQNLVCLDDFAYPTIPRHYEEALVLHQYLEKLAQIDLHGRQIDPQTRQRFERFRTRLDQFHDHPQEARLGLVKEFGSTYWYFYTFQQTTGSPQPPTNP